MPRAQPGQRFGGRQKGTPNKIPALLKDAIVQAAIRAGEELQIDIAGVKKEEGLTAYLKRQAVENPGPFLALLGKVLPLQINGQLNMDHTVTHINEEMTPQQSAEHYGETLRVTQH